MNLQKIKLFSELKGDELKYVESIGRLCVYPKGSTVFVRGQTLEGLYIINAGRVKVIILYADGREKTLAILGEGQILGETVLFDSNYCSATVETLDITTFFIISREHFRSLLMTSPELSFKIIELLSLRLRMANRQIEELTFLDAHRRIVCNLISLAEDHGFSKGLETTLPFSITHSELAKLAAVSRETATKVLKGLQKKELICMNRGKINILDMDKMKRQIL